MAKPKKAPKGSSNTTTQTKNASAGSSTENNDISADTPKTGDDVSTVQATEIPITPPDLSRKFIISPSDFSTSIEALLALEKENPAIQVATKVTKQGDFILQAKNEETFHILNNTTILNIGKCINLKPFSPPLKRTKMVLEGYPHGFPMERLLEHHLIESASRLKFWPTKEETRQVLVTIVGESIKEISLGIFGTFSLRTYYPEPLRCTKCQKFDHHYTKCKANPKCGVCSGNHASDTCIQKLKNGEKPPAKCPNCGEGHHAWNPVCAERINRLKLPPEIGVQRLKEPRSFKQKLHTWGSSTQRSPPSNADFPPFKEASSLKSKQYTSNNKSSPHKGDRTQSSC